ncbi:hypothetical protein BH11MYX1_BH11MYX1_27300 [soil metagenome]
MSAERSRTILILVVIAVIAGGAGFWFFKIYAPQQTVKAAQAEVLAWETKWTAARACLLGPTPGSSKTSQALAIRELTPDPWDRAGCAALIARLNRGEADDSGLERVEHAWAALDHAATKAAGAFATHIASPIKTNDPLPAALDELDAARGALRATVKLPVVAQAGATLEPAKLVPISDREIQMTALRLRALPSAHGFVVTAMATDQNYQIALRTGTTPVVTLANGVFPAAPDQSWGADVDGNSIEIGAFDPRAVIMGSTALALGDPAIVAAIGKRGHGEVVYANTKQFVIAHVGQAAPDALSATAEPAVAHDGLEAAVDVDGRAAIVWRAGKTTLGRILRTMDGAVDEAPVNLESQLGSVCLTTDRAWLSTSTGIVAFGGANPVTQRARLNYRLLGCTKEAALLRSAATASSYLICSADCREADLPAGAPPRSTVTAVANKLVAITSHAGVVGVWREDRAPVFYGLPELAEPLDEAAMAATDGDVIDVLAHTAKGYVVIRLPAR